MTTPTRKSLSKKQLATDAGRALLDLCRKLTSDGKITTEEAKELNAWISQNSASDLPAIQYLAEVLTKVLVDGIITPEELEDVYTAIETVLPPEERKLAKGARKERVRGEEELREPLYEFDFMVAGVKYDDRETVIRRYVREGDVALLVRDPNNRYDRNAIQVVTKGEDFYGFVPRDDAEEIAPLLDAGHPQEAYVKKILRGGSVPIPVVCGAIYREDHAPDSANIVKTYYKGATASRSEPYPWSVVFWALCIIGLVWSCSSQKETRPTVTITVPTPVPQATATATVTPGVTPKAQAKKAISKKGQQSAVIPKTSP